MFSQKLGLQQCLINFLECKVIYWKLHFKRKYIHSIFRWIKKVTIQKKGRHFSNVTAPSPKKNSIAEYKSNPDLGSNSRLNTLCSIWRPAFLKIHKSTKTWIFVCWLYFFLWSLEPTRTASSIFFVKHTGLGCCMLFA